MRLLTVGNMYPPHHLGGYELVWQQNVRHLRAAGDQVRVLTTVFRRPGREGALEDEDVHRELLWYWRDHDFPATSLRERIRLERHNADVLRRHLAEVRPDAVIWWAMGGMSTSLLEQVRRDRRPALAIVCDDWMLYADRVDGWASTFRGLRRVLAPLSERLTGIPVRPRRDALASAIFPSETVRRRALAAGWRPARTEVVNQGVDREQFPVAPERKWAWRLLYAGRIDARKGVDTAVVALSLLPESASLRIVGAGEEAFLEELRSLASTHGVEERVRFGEASRDALAAEYGRADVLLFPVRWREPWGLVPLEAMSVGTPVVASGRGGSGEYLRDGENCMLFDVDLGSQSLAEAVRRLAADPDLRGRLREGGFRTVEAIDPDAFDRAVERHARNATAVSA